MAKKGITKTIDNSKKLAEAINLLTNTKVMVGVPEDKDSRRDGKIGNAEIGYLMENGIPENNVPARPHLVPGVRRVRAKVTDYLKQAGRLAVDGRPDGVMRALMAAGQTAVSSVKGLIREGVPPPLADSTVARRASKRAGARAELALRRAGGAPTLTNVKPLINTAQYINSITYVIKKKK